MNPDGVENVGVHDLRHSLGAIAFAEGLTAPEIALLARYADARVTLAVDAGSPTTAASRRRRSSQRPASAPDPAGPIATVTLTAESTRLTRRINPEKRLV